MDPSHDGLAAILARRESHEEAVEILDRLVQESGSATELLPAAREAFMEALAASERHVELVEVAAAWVREAPGEQERLIARRWLADALEEAGRPELAVPVLQAVIEQETDPAERAMTARSLGGLLRDLEEWDAAVELCEWALDLAYDDEAARDARSDLYQTLGQAGRHQALLARGREDFASATDEDSCRSVLWQLAWSTSDADRPADAVLLWRELLACGQGGQHGLQVRASLAVDLHRAGAGAEAVSVCRDLLATTDLASEASYPAGSVGRAIAESGWFERSLPLLRDVLAAAGNRDERRLATWALAEAASMSDCIEEAERLWRQLVDETTSADERRWALERLADDLEGDRRYEDALHVARQLLREAVGSPVERIARERLAALQCARGRSALE